MIDTTSSGDLQRLGFTVVDLLDAAALAALLRCAAEHLPGRLH